MLYWKSRLHVSFKYLNTILKIDFELFYYNILMNEKFAKHKLCIDIDFKLYHKTKSYVYKAHSNLN